MAWIPFGIMLGLFIFSMSAQKNALGAEKHALRKSGRILCGWIALIANAGLLVFLGVLRVAALVAHR